MPPIKRSEYLKPLSREHHYSLLFGWKLKQGINHGVAPERMVAYIAYFWPEVLLPHFEEEERHLFYLSDTKQVLQAIDEHRTIQSLMEEAIRKPKLVTYESLKTLAESVDLHVRFEERTLFPFLEESLTTEQLMTAAAAIEASPALGDDYADHFWELGQQ